MGVRISREAGDDGWKTFSDDIFKIEITGPHLINLSVIDVPGLFRTKQDGETTDEDIAFVEEMVKSYIQNSRTIILAVLACNNDIATQSILRVCSADPHRISNADRCLDGRASGSRRSAYIRSVSVYSGPLF